MKTALVVGGTGSSGPFLVNGLQERGYAVTIFHRGTHEIPEIPANVEHTQQEQRLDDISRRFDCVQFLAPDASHTTPVGE